MVREESRFPKELSQVCTFSATSFWKFFWNGLKIWRSTCEEWQLEQIWDKEYVRTWIYFFHSCLKKILSVTRWIIPSKKPPNPLQGQQQEKATWATNLCNFFLCLVNKKLFPAAPIILLRKLFLSTGLPFLMSSTVSGKKKQSSITPLSGLAVPTDASLVAVVLGRWKPFRSLFLFRCLSGGLLSPLKPTWVTAQFLSKKQNPNA